MMKAVLLTTVVLAISSCRCEPTPNRRPALTTAKPRAAHSCQGAKNVCPDYSGYWSTTCPNGDRCIEFRNSCTTMVSLSYNIGCNGDGTGGAPQCRCTSGPQLQPGRSVHWRIVDGNYTSCLPSWQPPCLTAGLAVIANEGPATCASGTRVEFTAGNAADPYGKFDSYDLDIEKRWYSLPVKYAPKLACANDHANHDCRPLWCGGASCPDAYATPTNGGCPDNRSPQAGCQDTFAGAAGYLVELCPAECRDGCPSCQDAHACGH